MRAKSAASLPKLTVTPSTPPASAVRITDPHAADRGREEHRRNIGREEDVGPDMRKAPPRDRRERQAQRRKSDAEKQRRLRYAQPATTEIVDQCFILPYQPDQPIQIKAGVHEKGTRFPALRKAGLEVTGNIGSNMTASA